MSGNARLEVVARPTPLTIRARVLDGTSRWTCHLGDGTLRSRLQPDEPLDYTYRQPGVYSVTAKPDTEWEPLPVAWIVVRPGGLVGITIDNDPEDPLLVCATCTEPAGAPLAHYTIAWGDGATDAAVPLAGGQQVPHRYAAGTYHAVVTEVEAARSSRIQVTATAPTADPDFTLDADGLTATLTVAAAAARYARLTWGDASLSHDGTLTAGQRLTHTYETAGLYIVQAGYADADQATAKTITVTEGAPS